MPSPDADMKNTCKVHPHFTIGHPSEDRPESGRILYDDERKPFDIWTPCSLDTLIRENAIDTRWRLNDLANEYFGQPETVTTLALQGSFHWLSER